MKRLKGGVLANGLNSMVSAIFNTFPNSCFGQNNGVIQLTGVASRYVGFVVALMLILLVYSLRLPVLCNIFLSRFWAEQPLSCSGRLPHLECELSPVRP